ncbi:daptide biosynthesis RiPP recognition protein [Streptomyces cremeus]|uniref:Daptide biosynthesis RiPP recognition protein n=1 Tax=Streptomyces cremeus TaxID=66881 RepID=A0ABV5P996_STRCM
MDTTGVGSTGPGTAPAGPRTADRKRLKDHLISWATGAPLKGAPGPGVQTLVLSDAAHVPAVVAAGLVGPSTLLLAPDDGTGVPAPAVGYEGSLTEPGDELSNGQDFFLQTHSYASSPYMTVFGPTVVRLTDRPDFEAYLADADRALTDGVFPDFLLTSSVVLADAGALGGSHHPADGPSVRLYADPDGYVSTTPTGAVLGTVDDSLDTLTRRFAELGPDEAALGAVVPQDIRDQALRSRPFLPRYLKAITAMRILMAHGRTGLKVSGFGARLTPELAGAAADLDDAALPLVVHGDSGTYMVISGRLFAVRRETARALECLLAAPERVTALVPAAELDVLDELLAQHGVRLNPLQAVAA